MNCLLFFINCYLLSLLFHFTTLTLVCQLCLRKTTAQDSQFIGKMVKPFMFGSEVPSYTLFLLSFIHFSIYPYYSVKEVSFPLRQIFYGWISGNQFQSLGSVQLYMVQNISYHSIPTL